MDLYHRDAYGFPAGFECPTARVDLVWTRHADRARQDDRYGLIPRFANIPLSMFECIEIGVERSRVVKYVMRGHYKDNRDVIFVLIPTPDGKPWVVKTVWQNLRSDVHKTLDKSKYMR